MKKVVFFALLWTILANINVVDAQKLFAQKSYEGMVEMVISDHFDSLNGEISSSDTFFFLRNGNSRVQLNDSDVDWNQFVNEKVTITGHLSKGKLRTSLIKRENKTLTDRIALQTSPTILTPPILLAPITQGRWKTLVILVNFTNDGSQPHTPETIKQYVFTDPQRSVTAFFNTASKNGRGETFQLGGNVDVQGDVTPWITIPFTNSNCANNMFNGWEHAARQKATEMGWNLTSYDSIAMVFPIIPNCTISAVGTVGRLGDRSIQGRSFLQLSPVISDVAQVFVFAFAHELGRNLGLAHPVGQAVTNGPIYDARDRGEFMGMRFRLPTVITKMKLGWFKGKILTMQNSGTCFLKSPTVTTKTTQAIRIPLKDPNGVFYGESYWLETRTNLLPFESFAGPDESYYGVTIRKVSDNLSEGTNSSYLRSSNSGTTLFNDAGFTTGMIFVDPAYGITIEVLPSIRLVQGIKMRITLER